MRGRVKKPQGPEGGEEEGVLIRGNETCSSRAVIMHIFYREYGQNLAVLILAYTGRRMLSQPLVVHQPPLPPPPSLVRCPGLTVSCLSMPPRLRPSASGPVCSAASMYPFVGAPAPPPATPGARMSLYCHCCLTHTSHLFLSFGGIPLTTAPLGPSTQADGILATHSAPSGIFLQMQPTQTVSPSNP